MQYHEIMERAHLTYQRIAIPNTKLMTNKEKKVMKKPFIQQKLQMTNRASSWKHGIL